MFFKKFNKWGVVIRKAGSYENLEREQPVFHLPHTAKKCGEDEVVICCDCKALIPLRKL